MRISAVPVLAFMLLGCSKPAPVAAPPDPPAIVLPVEEPYHDAEKGAVKFGDAKITVKGAITRTDDDNLKILGIGLTVEAAGGKQIIVRGWGADYELLETLWGKAVKRNEGPEPHDIRGSKLKDENGNQLRPIMRVLPGRPVGTRERKLSEGETQNVGIDFEQPPAKAKELFLDLPGEDFGTTGRVRFRIPANMIQK